ncbi:MAG TPA: hypothetical protein VII94_03310 [Candidatus Saccharimonadales bacterium]
MKNFKSKASLIPGTSYDEVVRVVRQEHRKIEKMTKRQAYVRSTYFKKDKIFISIFWTHLMQKHRKERVKRLKLYLAAIDLMRNSRCEPETIFKKEDLSNLLHRFYGITKDGIEYCVQVKQDKRSGRKDFMSVFDRKNP